MKPIQTLYYITIAGLLALASCKRSTDVPSVASFTATADSSTHTLGVAATFRFTGNPDYITFYSGETGRRYAYRNRVSEAGTATLQFTSALNAGAQANSLHLVVSSDFKGVVTGDTVTTRANIAAATWTDITSRATLATSSTAVASGAVDVTDFATAGKPVYIAFKYVADAGSIQNKWTITGLTVTNTLADASVYTIANLVANNTPITTNYGGVSTFSPGWLPFPVSNTFNWVVTAGTSLVITGAATAALATASSEAWVLMGALNLQKVTPDVGVAIKNMSAQLPAYTYTYSAAGTYNAVFVAANANKDAADSVSRTVPLTIQ